MVSKTGKTQVANNSIGIYSYIYDNMNKYTGKKNPLVCNICVTYAVQVLPSVQAVVRPGDSDAVLTIIFQS